jgi:hypothetical protein
VSGAGERQRRDAAPAATRASVAMDGVDASAARASPALTWPLGMALDVAVAISPYARVLGEGIPCIWEDRARESVSSAS